MSPEPEMSLIRRWENLPLGVQIAIVGPASILLLWLIHVSLLNQPPLRGFSYGIFWGVLLTIALVGATRSERARRERSLRQ